MKSDRGGKVSWDARLIATVSALVRGGSGECRGRGRQWDLLGRSCKVSAFFTSPLRLSDATPSFRMTPQCPPGIVSFVVSRLSCLNRRLARFVFVAPVGSPSLHCLTHQNPRTSLNPVGYPLGPPWQPSSGSEDHSPLPHAARACAGLCLYTNLYLLVGPVV